MKYFIFLSFYLVCIYAIPPPVPVKGRNAELVNLKECTYGPTYWCKNITTAAGCNAVKHCIQTVWEHQTLPPDHSSICETCLEMVKQARDQLQSNETQEEIKEVFEGSCKLIPVKVVAEACIKIADEFVVELVDVLSSQMNPQNVCSVAGLCNNEQVNQLLDQMGTSAKAFVVKKKPDTCKGCRTVIGLIEKKFHQLSPDYILDDFLLVCGRIGSLSDTCSTVLIKYFNEIYFRLQEHLNPNEFCLMSGECSAMFHTHISDIEVRPLSDVGVVRVGEGSDQVCDLCKQLVQHLRDILVANTTEVEFKKVLIGICKQTYSFKDECVNLVTEYYPIIYNFLVNDLNGTVVCSLVGLCDTPGMNYLNNDAAIVPLISIDTEQSSVIGNRPTTPSSHAGSVQIVLQPKMQLLPIERIMPQTLTLMGNTELCTFCEYFLHFVQKAITDPITEDSIKKIVERACSMLPKSVNATCIQFVDTYGPAFIAILAQEIDPSIVCPRLSLCPSPQVQYIDMFMHRVKGDKPNCPMCLLAIESLEDMLKNKKTEETLRQALSSLCSHLHGTVEKECKDFVDTYTDRIVDALLVNLTPTEVCEYLHLCKDTTPASAPLPPKIDYYGGIVDTNEIPDNTANGVKVTTSQHSPLCVICEFILSELDKQLSDNATEEQIKGAILKICEILPKTVHHQCIAFIDEYADLIIQLLLQELDPSTVCTSLKLCKELKKEVTNVPPEKVGSLECELCKKVLDEIEHAIVGKPTEEKVVHALEHVCKALPKPLTKKCKKFVEKHGKDIIKLLISNVVPKEVCKMMQLCKEMVAFKDIESPKCELCKKILEEIEHLIVDKPTEEKIINAVQRVCKSMPKILSRECNRFIDQHGAEIIKLLEQNVMPKEVCKLIQLCRDVDVPICPLCRLILANNKDLTVDNATQEELFHKLQKGCNALPAALSSDCNKFLNRYGADIVQLLQLSVATKDICEMLLLCTTKLDIVRLEIRSCSVCNVALYHMNNILQNPKVSHTQKNVLEATCSFLSTENQEMCETIIAFNGEKLFKILSEVANPSMACSNAGLCPKRQLVGVNKCTWGPGYWCSNEAAAKECGMVSHCKQNVWTSKKPKN